MRAGAIQTDQAARLDAVFEGLFNEYQAAILTYLNRLVGDASKAEELAQDVFVKAYRALPKLPGDANHRAWLYRIATNAAYDHLRRSRLIRWLPLLDKDPPPLSASRAGEERDAVQRALAKLEPKYRVPLILFTVEEYSLKEIGEILGLSEGAVKTRLYRAREYFRQVYEEEN